MILADTNILIIYLRTADPKLLALFRSLPIAICGVTRAEVRCGVRNPAQLTASQIFLATFHTALIPDHLWDEVGSNLATLRAAGFAFPFPDVVIATLAIANGIELWTRDKQFTTMQSALPALQLFQEPP